MESSNNTHSAVHDGVHDGLIEWLERVKKLDTLINVKLEEREHLMSMARRMTPDMDGMPHAKGNVFDPVGNAAVKLVQLAHEIDRQVDEYIDHKARVTEALQKLPDPAYTVMYLHYINFVSWGKICDKMGYSRQQLWRIRKKSLKILQDVTPCYIEM